MLSLIFYHTLYLLQCWMLLNVAKEINVCKSNPYEKKAQALNTLFTVFFLLSYLGETSCTRMSLFEHLVMTWMVS